MSTKTERRNMIRILRRDLLVNTATANEILERGWIRVDGPIHDAVVVVDCFNDDDSGNFALQAPEGEAGRGSLFRGCLARWRASPQGLKRIADKAALEAVEAAKILTTHLVSFKPSERWPGTLEITTAEGLCLPLIPVDGEDLDALQDVYSDITVAETDKVRIRVDLASTFVEDFAKHLPADQPCADWVMMAEAA